MTEVKRAAGGRAVESLCVLPKPTSRPRTEELPPYQHTRAQATNIVKMLSLVLSAELSGYVLSLFY